MAKLNSRCKYCGRILYKNVSEKYFVCSNKCKSLIKKFDYINKVDAIVIGMNNYKWNTVEDLSKKVEINKFDFVSSVRRLIYFAISYPDYKEINQNGDQLMKYKDKWREKEKIIDEKLLNETYRKKKKVVKDNLAGVTLSDVLIMYNWLNYAKAIGDNNYQIISKDILKSNYMENELSQQLDIRNKEFSSIH